MLTYGLLRDTSMLPLTGESPQNGSEVEFRTLLLTAIESLYNEGRVLKGATVTRALTVPIGGVFTLNPTEESILQANTLEGYAIQVVSVFTYESLLAKDRSFHYGKLYLLDLGDNEQGLRQYSFAGQDLHDQTMGISVIVNIRPPQFSPYEDALWTNNLPIYPDCRRGLYLMMQSIQYSDQGNTEQALDYQKNAIRELNNWMARSRQGTLQVPKLINGAINQVPISNAF